MGSRSSLPITALRTVPCPTKTAQLGLIPVETIRSRCLPTGSGELPSFPSVSVVTPCNRALSAVGTLKMPRRAWVCGSIKPGATAKPAARISRPAVADDRSPIRVMRSPTIPMSAATQGLPEPSITRPPRMMMSNDVCAAGVSTSRQMASPAHSTRRPMRYVVVWSGSGREPIRKAIGLAAAVEAILRVGSSVRERRGRAAALVSSVSKQILKLGEDGAIGLLIAGAGDVYLVVELFALLVVIVVSNKERRAGVDAIGQ